MLSVEHLTKSFKLYPKPSDRLKEILLRRPFHRRYGALEDVSFSIADGETLGIIGRNGAGKSTLLKLLTGVMLPDSGSIQLSGKVAALLELGTGFDHRRTGRQNIMTNGLLVGMTHEEITEREDAIIEFSELGRYIEEPLRTYSSGMVMRLAFSIASHADPEIFLIDEALSVGDGHFQQKCKHRISEFRAAGGSIVFVSHDLNAIKILCDRAIVLEQGKVVVNDEPETAVNVYNKLLGSFDESETYISQSVVRGGYGSFEAKIDKVSLLGADSETTMLASGETAEVLVLVSANQDIPSLTIGMMIRDRFGQDVFGTNTHHLGHPIELKQGDRRQFEFRMQMRLAPGKYTLTIALHEGDDHTRHCYHWWDNVVSFEVAGIRGPQFGGICDLEPQLLELPVMESTE